MDREIFSLLAMDDQARDYGVGLNPKFRARLKTMIPPQEATPLLVRSKSAGPVTHDLTPEELRSRDIPQIRETHQTEQNEDCQELTPDTSDHA